MEEPEERSFTIFKKGEYPWRIIEINTMTHAKSSGNPMIPIKFEFSDGEGNTTTVYENLVFSDAAAWKVHQFLKSANGGTIEVGRPVNFEDNTFLKWLARQTGTAKLGIEPVQGKDYDRNKIEAFTWPKEPRAAKSEIPAAMADELDEIPF